MKFLSLSVTFWLIYAKLSYILPLTFIESLLVFVVVKETAPTSAIIILLVTVSPASGNSTILSPRTSERVDDVFWLSITWIIHSSVKPELFIKLIESIIIVPLDSAVVINLSAEPPFAISTSIEYLAFEFEFNE